MTTEALLQSAGVRPTANRLLVARCLAASAFPMSLMQIEDALDSLDKSSVFRVLRLFAEHHLVHEIDDGSGSLKYELCEGNHHTTDDGNAADEDEHVHFFCTRCRRTYCLDSIPVPHIALAEGYTVESRSYLVKGLCPHCRKP
jgi:Fur family ferric uptake transcriptional regulator